MAETQITHRFVQWNIRGLNSNYEDLITILKEQNPSILCLQETMHGLRTLTPPRNYHYIQNYTPAATPGQGLATLIKKDVPHSPVNLNTNLQAIAVTVALPSRLTVCNIYHSPNAHIAPNELEQLTLQLPTPFLIMGDLNCHHPILRSNRTNRMGKIIERLLDQNEISLLNNETGTRYNTNTNETSSPDITLCSSELAIRLEWSVLEERFGSDHYPVVVEDTIPVNIQRTRRPALQRADWSLFRQVALTMQPAGSNLDEMLISFEKIIHDASIEAIPFTRGGIGRIPVPWWNENCKLTRQQKKIAQRRYHRNPSIENRIDLNRARAIARREQRRARKQCWTDYINKIKMTTPLNKIFNMIKKIQGKFRRNPPITLQINGNEILEPERIANLLGQTFSDISSNNSYSLTFLNMKAIAESNPINFGPCNNEPYNDPIALAELRAALSETNNSACGEDGIYYQMIRNVPEITLNQLLDILNKCWREGSFPDGWARAVLLPFLKPGQPPGNVGSYRPVALTSCICKILEKIVNARLVHFMEENKLLNELQYGFRKMRGTEDVLARLEEAICSALNQKKTLYAIFFDIRKAYDTAWRYGILRTVRRFGIRGNMGNFIRNFLNNRTFKVKVGNAFSEDFSQDQGVPQGSVLSCTLFLIAMNEATGRLPAGVSATLYVDDLAIYMPCSYAPTAARVLQRSINGVSQWANENGFRLAPRKTVGCMFHKGRLHADPPHLTADDQPIEFKKSVKFLGLIFDRRMNFREHVESLRTRCTKAMNVLKSVSHLSWGGDRASILKLYRSLIRSKLDYGSQFYGNTTNTILKRLDTVHNTAMRLALGAFKSSPVLSLCAESGEMPLRYRRAQLALQHYVRLQRIPESPAASCVLDDSRDRLYEERLSPLGTRCRRLINDLNIELPDCLPHTLAGNPPWRLKITYCRDLCDQPKKQVSAAELRDRYECHIREKHANSIHIYTDGSKTEDGVGYAWVSELGSTSVGMPSEATIFTAEISAIRDAITYCAQENFDHTVIISDSRSSLAAIEHMKSPHPIVSQIQDQLIEINSSGRTVELCWVPSHIGVAGNEAADSAAAEAARGHEVGRVQLPFRDCYPKIKKHVRDLWELEWQEAENNKLRQIKDTVAPWPSSNQKVRKVEVMLCRLRIGHTLFTHRHLMERNAPPICEHCHAAVSVKHVLVECPGTAHLRTRHYGRGTVTLEDVLGDRDGLFDVRKLYTYLRDLGVTEI